MTGRLVSGLIAMAAGVVLLAPGAGAADADKERIKSKVNLQKVDFDTQTATGLVKSKEKICRKKRTVNLVEFTDYGERTIKKAKSGRDGSFKVKAQIFEIWQYKAVVKPKTVSKGNTKYLCKRGGSKLVSPS